MAASEEFDKNIDCVKLSNLNFCLQLSPFSANIYLKKTLIRDKSGNYMNPVILDPSLMEKHISENTEVSKKVAVLENTIDDLKHRLDVSETECENAHGTINQLKNILII